MEIRDRPVGYKNQILMYQSDVFLLETGFTYIRVNAGEFVDVMGPSGSGNPYFYLIGFWLETSGTICID